MESIRVPDSLVGQNAERIAYEFQEVVNLNTTMKQFVNLIVNDIGETHFIIVLVILNVKDILKLIIMKTKRRKRIRILLVM